MQVLRMRTHTEWNVPAQICDASSPSSFERRSLNSFAALFVKVMQRTLYGFAGLTAIPERYEATASFEPSASRFSISRVTSSAFSGTVSS